MASAMPKDPQKDTKYINAKGPYLSPKIPRSGENTAMEVAIN